jgi:hypothetical protein
MRVSAKARPILAALPLIGLFVFGCGGGAASNPAGGNSNSNSPSTPASTSVSVSPATANVRSSSSLQFTANVSGNSNTSVNWAVNGTAGGTSTLGTIDSSGNYTAPASLPSPNTVTVSATSVAATSASASSAVTLINPTPTLTGTNPASIGTGNFSLTISGSNFVSGAQVMLGTTPLTTTFVSSSQLTATGTANTAGIFSVTVVNPDPGSSSSNSLNLQVSGSQQASGCGQMSLGEGASLGGFVAFSSASPWNQDISSAAVDPNSTAIINYIGAGIGLHPDFGAG